MASTGGGAEAHVALWERGHRVRGPPRPPCPQQPCCVLASWRGLAQQEGGGLRPPLPAVCELSRLPRGGAGLAELQVGSYPPSGPAPLSPSTQVAAEMSEDGPAPLPAAGFSFSLEAWRSVPGL